MDKAYCKNPEIWGGIESTINRVNNDFFDQLTYAGHYQRETDIDQIADLNIKKLRYPILWEKHQPEKDTVIDWSWIRQQLTRIREKNIDVIAGLVHHGSGPAFTHLADKNFPYLLAEYARRVAEEFPWINYYTPVNEPLTTARFSGLYGLWYPHHKNPLSFIQMLLHELKAVVLSMQEIRKINPQAKLVQTEDLGKTYSTSRLKYQAEFENERRWLTYDLLCGKFNEDHKLWSYFNYLGIPEEDLRFFQDNPCVPDIFGFNHYLTSERYLDERLYLYPAHTHGGNGRDRYADVEAVRVQLDEETGMEVLLNEAWDRYQKPIAVTEVHLHCHREEQLRWFKYVWEAAKKLRSEKIDIRAITSWALLGSVGWNKLLTEPGGEYEPGAFDLRSGSLRPTALAHFIKEVNDTSECSHHLSIEKGWWQRDTRYLYGSPIRKGSTNKSSKLAPLLIIGKNGTLGKAFGHVCKDRCITSRLLSRQDCDISDLKQIESAIEYFKPWAVINAAGYVRVDDAEKEGESCFQVNTTGAHHLAIACNKFGVQLLTFSSDLVFNGRKNAPYLESDEPNPMNIYGQSKLQAEILVQQEYPQSLIIRTSAFFSPWDEYNFAYYIRKSLAQDEEITVANDITISPTYVPDLVNASLDVLIDRESGIWHMANKGAISWSDFAYEIADGFELDKTLIRAIPSSMMNYEAQRPGYSVLGSERGHLLRTFEQALDQYIHEEKIDKRKVA